MEHTLNRQGFGLIAGLVLQYVLGMAINLFVEFPTGNNPAAHWEFTHQNILVFAHLTLGTLLLLGAIAMVVRVLKLHALSWRMPATSGLVWMAVAWAAGDTFVTLQSDIWSYLMSLAFLLAVLSYAFGLYRSRSLVSTK